MSDHPSLPFTHQARALEILADISIFGALGESDLYQVFRLLKEVTYKRGETIFEQGSDPDHIYIVLEGTVQILCHSAQHPAREVEIACMKAGDCFGEISVIGIQPHTGKALARENCTLLVLSSQSLFSLHESNTALFALLVLNIAREACRRLYKTNEALLQYATHHGTDD